MPIDGFTIQNRVNKGLRIAASRVGFPFDVFRPGDAMAPLDPLYRMATIKAAFDASTSYAFTKPNGYGQAVWGMLADPDKIAVGDYLTSDAQGTFFVAAMQPLLPLMAVGCNDTISLLRVTAPQAFGAVDYRVDVVAQERPVFAGWPVSMLRVGTGRRNGDGIPGEEPNAEFSVLLPIMPGVPAPRAGDVAVNAAGARLSLMYVEASDLGFRMTARLLAVSA